MAATVVGMLLMIAWMTGLYNLGYLIAGKLFGFHLSEFNIGVGFGLPPLASFAIGTIQFQLRPLLLGGNVRFGDETNSLRYLITILAGPFTVMLLAFVILWGTFATSGYQTIVPEGVYIEKAGNIALPDGLLPGDRVDMINGKPVPTAKDAAKVFSEWQAGSLQVHFFRDGQAQEITFENKESIASMAISLSPVTGRIQPGVWEAAGYLPRFLREGLSELGLTVYALTLKKEYGAQDIKTLSVLKESANQSSLSTISGPDKLANQLFLIGLILFYLGLSNLLPIPGLVGDLFLEKGYKLMVGTEASKQASNLIHLIIFMVIIGLTWKWAVDLFNSGLSPATFQYQF